MAGGPASGPIQVFYDRLSPGHDTYRVFADINLAFANNPILGGDPWLLGSKAILPNSTANGIFGFLVLLEDLLPAIFDPPAAVGYDFAVAPNGPLFKQVKAPVAVAGHALTGPLHLQFGNTDYMIQPGETYTFPNPLSQFRINGIPEDFAVDPTDDQAFAVGLSFNQTGQLSMTMTPLTAVPEPSSLSLVLVVASALVGLRRRRNRRLIGGV